MSEKFEKYDGKATYSVGPNGVPESYAGESPTPSDLILGQDLDRRVKKEDDINVDTESLISDTTLVAHQEGIKPAFLAKATVLNKAIQDIGMGRYQYELFFSGGFGWFADNVSNFFT